MLFSRQKRAGLGKADGLKLAPAIKGLVASLAKEGWPGVMIIDRPDFSRHVSEINLDGEGVALNRQGRMRSCRLEWAFDPHDASSDA